MKTLELKMFGLMTPDEVAARWKCSRRAVQWRVSQGLIQCVPVRIGGRVQTQLFRVADVETFRAPLRGRPEKGTRRAAK